MTDREKMIEIIDASCWFYCGSNVYMSDEQEGAIADALIEAGFGNVTNHIVEIELLQRDVDNLMRTLEESSEEFQEAEHRAEVAERALLTACVNLIKDEEDNVDMELLARVVYTNYLRKAEKELAEAIKLKNGDR